MSHLPQQWPATCVAVWPGVPRGPCGSAAPRGTAACGYHVKEDRRRVRGMLCTGLGWLPAARCTRPPQTHLEALPGWGTGSGGGVYSSLGGQPNHTAIARAGCALLGRRCWRMCSVWLTASKGRRLGAFCWQVPGWLVTPSTHCGSVPYNMQLAVHQGPAGGKQVRSSAVRMPGMDMTDSKSELGTVGARALQAWPAPPLGGLHCRQWSFSAFCL